MIKGIVGAVIILAVTSLGFSPNATAQGMDPCLAVTTWWFDATPPPGWFNYSPYPGALVYLIAAHRATPQCAPSPECQCPGCCGGSPGGGPGGSPGGGPGGGGSGGGPGGGGSGGGSSPTPKAGSPVYLTTGDVYITQTDVSIPGLAGGLTLRRTWNSLWPYNEAPYSVGIFGPYWRSTYEERVFMGSDNFLKYSHGDGGFWSFGINASGVLVPASPITAIATLTQSATNWVITFQSGEKRQFSLATGVLTAIIDRNGNTTQLAYDGLNRLATVTDPASRHLYFNYQSPSSFLISSVTSDFGITVSYAYDAQGRLSQVTEPDLTTVSFTYNTQSQITQVTDSNGKVLESHTYDSTGRGLTSAQANGVNALTVTYPQ